MKYANRRLQKMISIDIYLEGKTVAHRDLNLLPEIPHVDSYSRVVRRERNIGSQRTTDAHE